MKFNKYLKIYVIIIYNYILKKNNLLNFIYVKLSQILFVLLNTYFILLNFTL